MSALPWAAGWTKIKKKEVTHSHQTSSSNPGKCSHQIQRDDVGANTTAQTSQRKGSGRNEQTSSPAEYVQEAAVQWLNCGRGEQVRGGDPGDGAGGAKFGANYCVC